MSTCKYHLSTNDGLLTYNVVQLYVCLGANNNELMCK